jgi:hypothetical protein
MKRITVVCRKRDPRMFTVQKYSNNEEWNVIGGTAPNGVHATRYLRKTSPDISKLNPLAQFLFENCPTYVGGFYHAFELSDRVQVFNGKTEADMLRDDASRGICKSAPWIKTVAEAQKSAEGFIHCYELENVPAKIDDWLFDIIEPEQSDEEYWNNQADQMIRAGAVSVTVNKQSFKINAVKKSPNIDTRIAEINTWLKNKIDEWSDRPDNQDLCRKQAASWKFRAQNAPDEIIYNV